MLQGLPRPTKTYRTEAYDAISPSRPELSLKGKTGLITGGGKISNGSEITLSSMSLTLT